MIMKKYKWIAESNDGSFEDESALFENEKECYNDMRQRAIEKMKWNTEFDEDFLDVEDGECIYYEVKFFKNKIIHSSYSGVYTYEIIEIETMNTFELTEDARALIADALKDKIAMWEEHNRIIAMHGVDDTVQHYIKQNNKKIGELKTLLNYINS